jgi:outer membrane lipoprotein LolB
MATSRSITILLSSCLLLAACASQTRMDAPVNENWEVRRSLLESITHWEFTGRIGVRDDNEAHSSRIRWRQLDDEFVINLWGTLNAGATEITGHPGHVVLVQEGRMPLIASSAEDLVMAQLGYALPVAQLTYWVKGLPAPGIHAIPTFNADNHLTVLQQDGWQIQYLAYTNFALESLPTRIRIEKPPLRLDFVRIDWLLP